MLTLACALLIGCATIPKPESEDDNLLIGIMKYTGQGYTNNYSALNGTHTSGIEVTFKNVDSNEEYKIRTQKNGLYYTSELPEGTYQLVSFYLNINRDGSSVQVSTTQVDTYLFTITSGVINNLGTVNFDGIFREGIYTKFPGLYNDVENEFRTQFPKTEWLNRSIQTLRFRMVPKTQAAEAQAEDTQE